MNMNTKKKVFTHFDSKGKAIMVDISTKKKTVRTAKASCIVSMQKETFFLSLSTLGERSLREVEVNSLVVI